MHDAVFPHEVERYQNLDCKSLDQRQTEALEVVHLYKVVKIYRQQLKYNNQVLSEHKLVELLNDVLLVVGILLVECFYQLGLHETLLI